jgi:hypothetical protein
MRKKFAARSNPNKHNILHAFIFLHHFVGKTVDGPPKTIGIKHFCFHQYPPFFI